MRRLLLIISLLALPAWSDVIITSGSLFSHSFGSSGTGYWIPTFSGLDFSITGGNGGSLNGVPFQHKSNHNCVFATATCSYDFTQTAAGIAGPATDGSHFTYNGITYPAPDIIRLTFNFLSSAVSGPAASCFIDISDGPVCMAPAFGPVAFTMTGSFSIETAGGTVLAADTFSGSGLASVSAASVSGETNISYQFTSTPEPASLTLIATGLALSGWLARRKRAA